MRTLTTRAHRRSVGLIGILALLLGVAIGATTASAAPPYATDAIVTSVDFTQESVESGSRAELSLTWQLPDNPAVPAGLVVDLPPELQGRTDSFPLTDADGVALAQCAVTATQVVCDFDDDYLAENPRDLHGDLSFWVSVQTEVTEETEVTYDVGGVEGTITVTPPPSGTCTENCDFTGRGSYKWGSYDEAAGTISWRVVVKAPAGGMVGGEELTVVDRPGDAQEITSVRVRHTNELVTDGSGRQAPGNYVVMDPSRYTVSPDLSTVTLTTEQGYFYVLDYLTTVTDGGASDTYTNEADLTIAGETTRTVAAEVINQGGGGSGSGTDVGRFSITKEVTGAAEAAAGLTFTGTYEVTTPAGDVIDGTFEVLDGETWVSDELPRGSVVRLSEDAPAGPEGVAWAAPAFSDDELTLTSGTSAVTLTNEATLLTGAFSISKVINGDGADLVPADASFVVGYSYPAGPGFEAGSGELVVPADGTAVDSPQLPAGAEVTLTEATPDDTAGIEWTAAEFSDEKVPVQAGESTAVVLTNTATAVPPSQPEPPAEQPSQPVAPVAPLAVGTPQLPSTGADLGGPLLGAIGLIVAGTALLALRRRRAA